MSFDKNVKIFKLNYAGALDEIPSDMLLNSFVSIHVLVIHIPKHKRMYTWIGKKASQSLLNYVAKIRELLVKDRPELTTLRNVSVDQGVEPGEFFSDIGFKKGEFEDKIKNQDTRVFSVISDIDQLKIKKANCIMLGNYAEAIQYSNEIKELAKEIAELSMIKSEESFIENADRVKDLLQDFDVVNNHFEELIQSNKIAEAHEYIEDLKNNYSGVIESLPVPKVQNLLSKSDDLWNGFLDQQEGFEKKLSIFEFEIKKFLEADDYAMVDSKLDSARDLLEKSVNEELKEKWLEIEKNISNKKGRVDLINQVEEAIEEGTKAIESFEFDNAITKIESTIESISDKELPEYDQKLNEKRDEIIKAKDTYHKRIKNLEILEKSVVENQQASKLDVALKNCEKIIQLAPLVGKGELVDKYSPLLHELKKKMEELDAAKAKEQEELQAKAEEISQVIEIEENVMPIVEEYSAKDLLGDLSSDMDQMLEQVSSLLTEHRVEIKTEVQNRAILVSATGEFVELEQSTQIQEVKGEATAEGEAKITNILQTSIDNPFDDYIEEAILTDLIPYNFEIEQIEINGEEVKELPDLTKLKDGLEVKWTLQNIPPKQKTEINYNLRRRVSRTIVFMLDEQLKFIKTHSKLTQLELEGLYDAVMPFNNTYGKPLEGVVIEDIVPLYYVNSIKEPLDYQPNIASSDMGELVEWRMGALEAGTYNYHYKLIEIFKFEELKIKINSLSQQAENTLKGGNITKSLELYKEIITLLENYYK